MYTLKQDRRRGIALVTLAPLVANCDRPTAQDPNSDFAVRDSAGIQIVENHTPVWQSTRFWAVDPEPLFAIGGYGPASDAGSASHLVWNIWGAVPLSDGRVAMLSPRGNRKVLIFESSGELSTSFGREGQGPGEFSYAQHFQVLPGDTIAVWDYMFGPVSYFDPTGALLRHRRIDFGAMVERALAPGEAIHESVGQPLPDGSFLVEAWRPDWLRPTKGVYQPPVRYLRIDSVYTAYSFGWWDGAEELAISPPSLPIVPFTRRSIITGGGNPLSVYVAPGDRYEIHQFSATGVLRRIIRRRVEPTLITSREIDEWIEDETTRNPHLEWSEWKRAVTALPRRFHDPISTFRVDPGGYLWTMDKRRSDTSEWSVYSPEGHWLGTLEMPLPRVTWIGEDIVVGVQTDPVTGVETVEGYRLNRDLGPAS